MKYLLFGDDALTLRSRKQALIATFLETHPEGQVISFAFDAQNQSLESLGEALLPDLFGVPKFLVVEGLESAYEGNKEQVEHIVSASTSADVLLIEYQKLAKTHSFLKLASKQVDKEESYDAKKRDIKKHIQELEKSFGGHLDARTIALIQERCGKDDELVLQSIQKVLTYAEGKGVSGEELDALVPAPVEAKIFDALDALAGGDKEKAYTLFSILLAEEDIFRIFPLCAWQIRQMLLVTEGKAHFSESKDKIAKETGIHPFVVQKLLRVLPRFSRARLARGLKMLSELDVDLKQGRCTPEGALERFVFQW